MTAANGAMQNARMMNGILPVQDIRRMIADGEIAAATDMTTAQMQPASIDLRLGLLRENLEVLKKFASL